METIPWYRPFVQSLEPEPRITPTDWGRFGYFCLGIVAGIALAAGWLP
jgi:hypothetical protein